MKHQSSVVYAPSRRGCLRFNTCVTVAVLAVGTATVCAQSMSATTLERVKHATVMVKMSHSKTTEGDTPLGSGTGFFVNSTGLCITNDHVIDPGHKKSPREKQAIWMKYNRLAYTVVVDSGTSDEKEYKAELLYSNDQADMGVLQVLNEDGDFLETPDYLRFYPTTQLEPRTKLWDLGFPGGESRKQSNDKNATIAIESGNVIEVTRTASGRVKGIRTSLLANPGNSGGPSVDISGRLVGIATLAGAGEGAAAFTILVPADLTREMIGVAFREGKVPADVDIGPLYDSFVGEDHIWDLPQMPRRDELDCITLETSSRICGEVSGKSITWPSLVGDIEVPNSAVAYVVSEEDGVMLFLDGGDRCVVDRDKINLRFSPVGGEPIAIDMDDVDWIAFRIPAKAPTPPSEPAYVISGDDVRISIVDVEGKAKFQTDIGKVGVSVADIKRIKTEDADRILYTTAGSRMSGRFAKHEFKGRLAWSGTPISFSLRDVEDVELLRVDYATVGATGEGSLTSSLDTSDPRLVKIASLIDANDLEAARPLVDELLTDRVYRAMASEKKEQVQLLNGEQLLRSAKFDDAKRVFKKLRRAKAEKVLWYARSRLAVLERFEGGAFEGAPLSDTEVFENAARSLAEELIEEAAHAIDGMETSTPRTRGEFLKLRKRAGKVEESLNIANRLIGGESDEYLLHLWRNMTRLMGVEANRLQVQREDIQEQRNGGGRSSRRLTDSQRQRLEKKIDQIGRDIESLEHDAQELQAKIADAGFIIDDPELFAGGDK